MYDENELISVISSYMGKDYMNDVPHEPILRYYHGHRPKFQTGLEWIYEVCTQTDGQAIELGAKFPFYTYFLGRYQGWTVKCVDISIVKNHLVPDTRIFITYGNLNYDDLGKDMYDLVVISEVIEHLSCNLINLRDRVVRSLKSGGYLFTSYPLGGMNSSPSEWDKEYDMTNFDPNTHKREFREDTWSMFFELPVLRSANVNDPFYSNIKTVLYRKP